MNKVLLIAAFLFLSLSQIKAQVCVGTPGELRWEAWENLYEGFFSELTAHPRYPHSPDVVKNIYRLKTTVNYNDYYGSRVQGFISVPSNTVVDFNVTGNDQVEFYLSTDDNPSNKTLIASVPESVSEEEHTAFPEQTSSQVNLVAGQYYYFEVRHVDRWGTDRFSVFWRTNLVSATQWNVITAAYLYGVGCEEEACPEAGTQCDDGDISTLDDVEDGNCNCFGQPDNANVCAGERGKLTAYRYDGIAGGGLNDLYEAANFPGMPASSESCEVFGRGNTSDYQDIGFALQAYLTVPVSGHYKFNVTGDDNTILFLSSDENPENKQAHQVLVSSWTGMTEHDKFIYQSTSFLYLERGKYYYMEINQKDGGGGEHFSAFWQTPFTEAGVWKRIPAVYFYDYECELACIPAGTACDDGDPFTNNDMYDENCDCVGTPCSGPDCDSPLANYIPKEKCAPSKSLDNNTSNGWVSCSRTTNPNTARGESHWILYDLGDRHELHKTQIWNYNAADNLSVGMTNVSIDYSLDGNTWTEYGSYNWPLANGSDSYGGFAGPNLNGTYARYVLITSLDAGSSCKGLGKVAFTAVQCPMSGTPCDDHNELTTNDQYDENCNCAGASFAVNDCGEDEILLGDSVLYTNKFSAIERVSSESKVAAYNRVAFIGGGSITLEPGFQTNGQTVFTASIDPCDNPQQRSALPTRAELLAEKAVQREKDKIDKLCIRKVTDDIVNVSYFIDAPGKATLGIYDVSGNLVYTLMNHNFTNQGLYQKTFRSKKLGGGSNYVVRLVTGEAVLNKAFPKAAVE